MHSTLISLILLSAPIHAITTARVWTHFYPSCPENPYSDLSTYENYEETTAPIEVSLGQCASVVVPSHQRNLVGAVSLDAEYTTRKLGQPFPEDGPICNITLHEVPDCVDKPLITRGLPEGVEVSQCTERHFTWSQVWVKLVCETDVEHEVEHTVNEPVNETTNESKVDDGQNLDFPRMEETTTIEDDTNVQIPEETTSVDQETEVQNPGSNANSWEHSANQIEPEQESRVDNAGHAESDAIVHRIMEELKDKSSAMNIVSGKHNSTGASNATAPGAPVVSRRKFSVLRNRATRLY
ncbi:hypothetical protein N7495_002398 [Penicillium taxi]|uniref:uncharacterized protein n=1 Tax=Penicillium taxi TaxID=168475 RepID=UPI0025451677|nr:uncharacterized protein N7495_002398 [Penicillium taxi]KAJ5901870.1 hypothetical protein N7495_002398 [Penicillium taxi]